MATSAWLKTFINIAQRECCALFECRITAFRNKRLHFCKELKSSFLLDRYTELLEEL